MAKIKNGSKRIYIGKDIQDEMELPDLVSIQLNSYERFLQWEKIKKIAKDRLENPAGPVEKPDLQGLEEVFQSIFKIESPSGDMVLEYEY